jgi:DNA-binding NarL/FixJ family response regulator
MESSWQTETNRRCEGIIERYLDRNPAVALALQLAPDTLAALQVTTNEYFTRPRGKPTPEAKAAALAALAAGAPLQRTATAAGISPRRLRDWAALAKVKWKRLRKTPTAKQKIKIIELIRTGYGPTQIARRLKLNPATVAQHARAAGYHFQRGRIPRLIARPDQVAA